MVQRPSRRSPTQIRSRVLGKEPSGERLPDSEVSSIIILSTVPSFESLGKEPSGERLPDSEVSSIIILSTVPSFESRVYKSSSHSDETIAPANEHSTGRLFQCFSGG